MLRKIKKMFEMRDYLSSKDISLHLGIEESAVKGMLSVLEKKRYIAKLDMNCTSCSSNCNSCPFSQGDIYQKIH